MIRRRRRRPVPDSGRLVEDAFDLFLDALANAFGVIMFIALMIVIFAPPTRSVSSGSSGAARVDPSEAARVTAHLQEAAALDDELARLPPAGDPALVERFTELDRVIAAARARLAGLLESLAERADAVRAARREAHERLLQARDLDARRADVERRLAAIAATTSFVRVSRFRDDPRDALLLLVADGGVERAELAPGQTRVRPGAHPRLPLRSIDDARAAADALLRKTTPARHRVEIGVWSDSFAEYKRLERVLVERGFDLNPMPLQAGEALEAGSGGIQ